MGCEPASYLARATVAIYSSRSHSHTVLYKDMPSKVLKEHSGHSAVHVSESCFVPGPFCFTLFLTLITTYVLCHCRSLVKVWKRPSLGQSTILLLGFDTTLPLRVVCCNASTASVRNMIATSPCRIQWTVSDRRRWKRALLSYSLICFDANNCIQQQPKTIDSSYNSLLLQWLKTTTTTPHQQRATTNHRLKQPTSLDSSSSKQSR